MYNVNRIYVKKKFGRNVKLWLHNSEMVLKFILHLKNNLTMRVTNNIGQINENACELANR